MQTNPSENKVMNVDSETMLAGPSYRDVLVLAESPRPTEGADSVECGVTTCVNHHHAKT